MNTATSFTVRTDRSLASTPMPRLRAATDRGPVEFDDIYAFPPVLGDLDIHLLDEGRHLEAYKVMGAHCREIDGASGVAFAVWAPNARRVSVVGDVIRSDRSS